MRVGAIIFARLGSSRLPGKMLMDIGGRTLLGRVVDRSKAISNCDEVVVATSDSDTDDTLAAMAVKEGVQVFRGDLEDVAGRALACAREFGFEAFARICGDRPFFDPGTVATLVQRLVEGDLDLVTNAAVKSFPPGLTAEVVATKAMARVVESTVDAADREHVTRYFYANMDEFRIKNIAASQNIDPSLSLVVDTEEDLDRVRFIAGGLGDADGPSAPMERILDLAASWYSLQSAQSQKETAI